MTSSDSSQANSYVREAFSLDPRYEAENLLRIRNEFLLANEPSGHCENEPFDIDNTVEWESITTCEGLLAEVRSKFAADSKASVDPSLQQAFELGVPHLLPALERTRIAAQHRSSLQELRSQENLDQRLIRTLERTMFLPPEDVGLVREQFLASLDNRSKRRKAKATVRYIAKHVPAWHLLQKDWLTTVEQFSTVTAVPFGLGGQAGSRQPSTFQRFGWLARWWPLYILIVVRIGYAIYELATDP